MKSVSSFNHSLCFHTFNKQYFEQQILICGMMPVCLRVCEKFTARKSEAI